MDLFAAEVAAFPEYYEQYFKTAMFGGASPRPCRWSAPGRSTIAAKRIRRDIDNLKAPPAGCPHQAVFMPAIAPSGVGKNEYYDTEEESSTRSATALRTEYKAIVDAGFCCRSTIRSSPTSSPTRRRRRAANSSAPRCMSRR